MDLIDGNLVAAAIIAELKAEVASLKGRKPCIALVRVGEDPASVSYVKKKEKTAAEIGITSRVILPPVSITQEELFALLDQLNADGGTLDMAITMNLRANVCPRMEAASSADLIACDHFRVDAEHSNDRARSRVAQGIVKPVIGESKL